MGIERELKSGQKRYYFVDEGGDPVLFNRHKKDVVGTEGCSTFFMVGLLDVEDPDLLGQLLEHRRQELLADPYFKGIPSMQPERKKTAVTFHAKDDIPEVRWEVFRLLVSQRVHFFAVIRDKRRILQLVKSRNAIQRKYRYHPNQLYDRCVARLFRDRLHKDDSYRIVFAKRGTSDRTEALQKALENSRSNFRRKWGVEATAPIEVVPSMPYQDPCLQAVDYFVWALQRLMVRQEERYWQFIWPNVSFVHDIDDVRTKAYGQIYSQRCPLRLADVLKRMPGDIGPNC